MYKMFCLVNLIHTAKSNLLNEIKKVPSLPSYRETSQLICCANQSAGSYMRATLALNGLKDAHYHLHGEFWSFGATVTNFMARLQQVRKILKCSWWNFCKTALKLSWMWSAGCSSDWYDFKFSTKATERKSWTKDQTHLQETEIIDIRKVPK